MQDGLLRVLRMYCGYEPKAIAEAAGISFQRYKRIEIGEEEPTDEDIRKFAAIFRVSEEYLRGESGIDDVLMLRQSVEELIFASEKTRDAVKLRVTELSDAEKKLILLVRSAENKEQALNDAINAVLGI